MSSAIDGTVLTALPLDALLEAVAERAAAAVRAELANAPTDAPEWMTTVEVADLLKMSSSWVKQSLTTEIPSYQYGRALRFSRSDVLAYAARCRVEPGPAE